VIEAAKKVTGVDFMVKYEGRRLGDPPLLVADSQKLRARGIFLGSGVTWNPSTR